MLPLANSFVRKLVIMSPCPIKLLNMEIFTNSTAKEVDNRLKLLANSTAKEVI